MRNYAEEIEHIAKGISNIRIENGQMFWEYKGNTYYVLATEMPELLVPQDPETARCLARRYGSAMQVWE